VSTARLVVKGEGVVNLSGALNFSSTPDIWLQLKALLEQGGVEQISLSGVESSNSAALAMLIEAKAMAKRLDRSLQITDLPEGLRDLANISNALELI